MYVSNSWGPPDDGDLHPGPSVARCCEHRPHTGRRVGHGIRLGAGNGALANDNSNYDGYANNAA
jgi:hypothetical protein